MHARLDVHVRIVSNAPASEQRINDAPAQVTSPGTQVAELGARAGRHHVPRVLRVGATAKHRAVAREPARFALRSATARARRLRAERLLQGRLTQLDRGAQLALFEQAVAVALEQTRPVAVELAFGTKMGNARWRAVRRDLTTRVRGALHARRPARIGATLHEGLAATLDFTLGAGAARSRAHAAEVRSLTASNGDETLPIVSADLELGARAAILLGTTSAPDLTLFGDRPDLEVAEHELACRETERRDSYGKKPQNFPTAPISPGPTYGATLTPESFFSLGGFSVK
jgi:hypothetical protein